MKHNCCNILLISVLLALYFWLGAVAKERTIFKGIDGTLLLGGQYDDNTNDYSEKYIALFKNDGDPGRFHVASIDDATGLAKLGLEAKFNFFKRRKTSLNASALYKQFADNRIDQYGKYTIGIGQQVARKTYLHCTYVLVPHYYLYHFRDKDWVSILGRAPEVFQPFDYAKDAFLLRILQYVGKETSITSEFEYARYFYNEHYTEYNSKRYIGSLRGNRTINENIVLNCGYSFGFNDAKGFDGDITGETKQNSDDADDSFWEHTGALGAQWYLPELFNTEHSVNLKGSLCYRDYTSRKDPVLDKTHAGRLEYTLHVSAAYTISIAKPLDLQVEYGRTQRWAGSSYAKNNTYIHDEKDYSKNVAALTLQYAFGK